MQSRFLPWAGCTISDLKLTHSSAQGEGSERVSRSWAKPVLQTTAPASRLIFPYPGQSVLSEKENSNTATQQDLPRSHTGSLPGAGLGTAQGLTLGSYTCLQTRHSWDSHIWTLHTGIFQTNSELATWAHRAVGSCDSPEPCCAPDQAVSQRVVISLRASEGSQHRSSSSCPWGAPVQQMRLIVTAPSCCSWAFSSQIAQVGFV